MTTERLDSPLPHSNNASQVVTLAFATLASSLALNDSPTYIPNVPSELIRSFFASEQQNVDMQKLIYTIRTYSTFEMNWDGYNGTPPKDETIKDTIHFLKRLPNDFALPYAGLSGDGEINLFWDKDSIFIDIGFTGDGKFSYYARDSKGKEFSGNYIFIFSDLPRELTDLIKTIKL